MTKKLAILALALTSATALAAGAAFVPRSDAPETPTEQQTGDEAPPPPRKSCHDGKRRGHKTPHPRHHGPRRHGHHVR